MTTRLDKTLKRELTLDGRTFILAVSPDGLKLTLKGKRKGQELRWGDLVSGDAALATALNASLGSFAADEAAARAHKAQEMPASNPRIRQSGTSRAQARKPAPPRRKSAAPSRKTSKPARRARKG
jgi:hypothetical protein